MSDVPVPVPDDKDWTWVLEKPCSACGFDADSISHDRIARLVRKTAIRWQSVLALPDVRVRPSLMVWSALEYASHCRDVYEIFGERVTLMLEEDDPQFANWDQDATAIERRYGEAHPALVAAQLAATANDAATAFEAVTDEQWSRTGRRSNGSVFTVESLGRYFVHDLVHHMNDVGHPVLL